MKSFTYEQFVAGALQKFDNIDNIDISILVKNIKDKLGINFVGPWNCSIPGFELSRVIKYDFNNGSVGWGKKFEETKEFKINDDYVIPQELVKDSLKARLQTIAGEEINRYFSSLYMKSYKKQKADETKRYQEQTPQHASILLISELREDYDELVKMGFTRINWFKPVTAASEYFEKNPDSLKGHNIIILSRLCALSLKPETRELINKEVKENNISLIQIDREAFERLNKINVWIYDSVVGKYKQLYAKDIDALYEAIVECALTNQLIDGPIKASSFKPITNIPSTNRVENHGNSFVYLKNELYVECQMIESYLNTVSNGNFVLPLSNQYRVRKLGDNISISGIYDGSRTSFTVYVGNNKYKVYSMVDAAIVRLFIEEISEEIRRIKKREKNRKRQERRKRKTMFQEND